jgi:hypothetical protein
MLDVLLGDGRRRGAFSSGITRHINVSYILLHTPKVCPQNDWFQNGVLESGEC